MLRSSSSGASGRSAICIAVLDGPVDLDHPCFHGARIETLGEAQTDPRSPATAHGTHVASIIFGQPGSAVPGLAPHCRGLALPIFSGSGETGLSCSQMDLARAIAVALERGANIINISGGQLHDAEEPDGFLTDMLAQCEAADVLVVAAAGNDGCDCAHLPASFPTVLAVGAADNFGNPLKISNWGAHYSSHGILAPGQDIAGAAPDGGVVHRTGTSFATPIVSGLAGRMLAEQRSAGRTASPLHLRKLLIGTAIKRDSRDPARARYLAGGLNLPGILKELNGGRSVMTMQEATLECSSTDDCQAPQVRAEALAPSAPDARILAAAARAEQGHEGRIAPSHGNCSGGEDCGCGCGGAKNAAAQNKRQLVFALGQIGFDFGSEARRDSILQFMREEEGIRPRELLTYLRDERGGVMPDVERIIWTLKLDETPIYAIQPAGAFAFNGYADIVAALDAQTPNDEAQPARPKAEKQEKPAEKKEPVTLFAVAGILAGSVRLMSGEVIPVLVPSARGITSWDVDAAVTGFIARARRDGLDADHAQDMQDRLPEFLGDFRNVMTRKYRNLGLLGRDRALNFAATSAFRVYEVLKEFDPRLIIDDIAAVKSPACRPGSECYDVRLTMFTPSDTTNALQIYQFTVDVSDTIPVSIGAVWRWRERPKD